MLNGHCNESIASDDIFQIVRSANLEGVTPLLFNSLIDLFPGSALNQQIQHDFRQDTARAILLQEERQHVLHHLEPSNPIILKGEALAYACYNHYRDRPMVDLDLLIDESLTSTVDTELFNRPALQGSLSYQDLFDTAQHGVHPSGIIPRTAHLLLHAILHLLAHHFYSRLLIWLYDIKLLLDKLDESECRAIVSVCRKHKITAVVLEAIDASSQVFPHDRHDLVAELRDMTASQDLPHFTGGLENTDNQSSILLQDWKYLREGRQRRAWLRQHLAPPPGYLRQKYKLTGNWPLPFFICGEYSGEALNSSLQNRICIL
ncbi:MAG: nucleotidyltransferase family protein [Gammaproteobacteria bacterium]